MPLATALQYADLVISDLEFAHMDKTGEFLGVQKHRDAIAERFDQAINAALDKGMMAAPVIESDE